MGCYVNPPNQTKEQFLREKGERTAGPKPVTETHLPVCLVDNGMFTAAAVGFCEEEVTDFQNPRDTRPKQWYYVSREDLREVSDLVHFER